MKDEIVKAFTSELTKFCKEKGYVSTGLIGYATGLFAKHSQTFAEEYHREKSKWISVEERLPEPSVMVLAYYGNEFIKYCKVCYISQDKHWYKDVSMINNVTHWQPLPEPPK